MEEYFMAEIWRIVGHKENQGLTPKQQQDKITEVLKEMRLSITTGYTEKLSKLKKAISKELDSIK